MDPGTGFVQGPVGVRNAMGHQGCRPCPVVWPQAPGRSPSVWLRTMATQLTKLEDQAHGWLAKHAAQADLADAAPAAA